MSTRPIAMSALAAMLIAIVSIPASAQQEGPVTLKVGDEVLAVDE